jgi:long-chain acyl-CoA synthetase
MYTSGSTGDPKGVMIQQKTLVAQMASVYRQFKQLFGDAGAEVYLGYLPLAHILELVAEFFYYGSGNCIGYSDPKSLLAGPEKCAPNGGLDEFEPTLMAGVPKVWESIKSGALAKVKKAGPTAEFLVSLAIKMKSTAKKQYRYTPIFDVLLKKFKKTTGGNLKACLSGGGAISGEVQEWVRTALDCPLVQGYGLTETCAGTTIQMPDDMSIGIAGTPISSMEIALHSEPDITDANGNPYLANDTVHSNGEPCSGRGEVWISGTNLSSGYYKMPELTASEFGSDGFFKSGDIGMLTPGGALKIVDRKKNLVKLKGGEYVALEKMNTAYNNSPFVNVDTGGVCCFADDSLDRAVAIAQCKEAEILAAAKEVGVSGSAKDAAADPKVQAKVVESFKVEAKKAGLTSLETVVAVFPIVNDDWTPINGCLTATQKLVPKKCYAHNAKELEIVKKKGNR